jgi:hypothetical protein
MKSVDLFYRCYGGREIKLLGVITSDITPHGGQNDGLLERSYEIIKESINK